VGTSIVPALRAAARGKTVSAQADPSEFGLVSPLEAAGRYGHICPRGAFCPGNSQNFTLCPPGTYQPLLGQPECLRCPLGYTCPHFGMIVPRICPAGYVCDVRGLERAEQPCPEGHFCLEGTVTTATTCGDPGVLSDDITLAAGHAQQPTTIGFGKLPSGSGGSLFAGSRRSGCFDNSTADYALQHSSKPARFWDELRQLPLPPDSPFEPRRGRFCQDDRCLRLEDESDVSVVASDFDYSSQGFRLRRPVPCPPGTYCQAGTGSEVLTMHNFSAPQACFGRGAHCAAILQPWRVRTGASGVVLRQWRAPAVPRGDLLPPRRHVGPAAVPPRDVQRPSGAVCVHSVPNWTHLSWHGTGGPRQVSCWIRVLSFWAVCS
jgi:hypothetical protein